MIFNRGAAASPSTSPSSRSTIVDEEFGIVPYRRSPQTRFVRIRVTEAGEVRASLPKRAPLYMVHELLDSSRAEIRKLVAAQKARLPRYEDGEQVGHSHRLHVRYATNISEPRARVAGQTIDIVLPVSYQNDSEAAQPFLAAQVRKALKREAQAYLPRRLRHLADMYGFSYERERFGNQKGRWASCSSTGTISMNVALMNLPFELIDYVLIHELAHTRQMNHSPAFWSIVESCMPDYKVRRKALKNENP